MTLEQFTKEVKASDIWMEMIRVPARGKDLDAAILKVYGQVVSDETLTTKQITEHRKHIFNTLGTMPFGKQNTGVQLQQTAPVSEPDTAPVRQSVPPEVQQKRLADWLKSIEEAPEPKRIARKVPGLTLAEIQEEGQERPKRPVYMRDDAYVHENARLLHESRIKTVRERHPELSDEEVKLYVLEKFGK